VESEILAKHQDATLKHTFPEQSIHYGAEPSLQLAPTTPAPGTASKDRLSQTVLGLARTGLIFTRNQEGTQLGGLTKPGQTEQGIRYHVPSCWVLAGGGSWAAGRQPRQPAGRVALCILLFVLCILLISIVVVPVPFVCCSVKLPLSRPTSFCLFLSILLPTPAGGGAIEQPIGPILAGHSQTITQTHAALTNQSCRALEKAADKQPASRMPAEHHSPTKSVQSTCSAAH